MESIEKIDYKQLLEEVDFPALSGLLHTIYQINPIYTEKLLSANISRDTHLTTDDFCRLPFMAKDDLLREQACYPPFGRMGTLPEGGSRVHFTSGTTGKPLYILMSRKDILSTAQAGAQAFRCAGLHPGEIVIHCLNYCLWAGGLTDHLSLEAAGATVIPFGVGNSSLLIRTILDTHADAISCTPSYLSRLELVLANEFALKPADLKLQKAYLGGEGGVQNPVFRAAIEEKWGLQAIDANYGMADVLSIFGSECPARSGLHFHGQGLLHAELIDPSSLKTIPLEDGAEGELVLTHLKREIQPLVRFRTKDVIQVISTKQCCCGRSSFRFVVKGRSDDMLVVSGINIFPTAFAKLLSSIAGPFSGEFEFVIDSPPPIQCPLIRIELSQGTHIDSMSVYQNTLLIRCREQLNFTPRVEFISFGQFPRTDGKTPRVRRTYLQSK